MSVTPQTNTTIEEIAERLRMLDSFALCGHVSPDGDCIGSALGLSHALRMLGKKTTCLLAADASIEPGLRFLPGADELIYAGDYDETPDAFIALDVPTTERIKDRTPIPTRRPAACSYGISYGRSASSRLGNPRSAAIRPS